MLQVGGDVINFGLVSGTPNVHDNINGRRAGNFEDYKKLISFGQYFNVLTFYGNQATAPTDMPANSRHLDTTFVNLTLSDKAFLRYRHRRWARARRDRNVRHRARPRHGGHEEQPVA